MKTLESASKTYDLQVSYDELKIPKYGLRPSET